MAVSKTLVMLLLSIALSSLPTVSSLGATDTITWGGDVSRAGYQTNHNMDPAIVGSGSFGQIFRTALPGNFGGIGPEQLFSQSLVYTGADGVQYIYLATTQNNIYKLNAATGAIVAQRNLWVPFLTADLDGCVDINPTVGVTGTGVIDPNTGIWYFTAKTYANQFQNTTFGPSNPPGRLNGRYYFHGINTADLTDAMPPKSIEGTIFRNNPNRMFISGNQHQRPALLDANGYIYAGFASHCVKWNFTGAILGFNKQTGAIVEAYAMEGGPEPNTIPGGGVWMSGGGLAYDGQGSMYFGTGNGYASELPATGESVPGRDPPLALEEAAVNAKLNADGTMTVIDFFMPWEKTQLDGADKDLGTSPLELLPTNTFSCPNQARIGVITGKSGKTYWLNLDDLGGYQNGANKLDNVIQVFQNENSVYAGAGVMPLGGGYIYINVIQYPSHVFKFSCNAQGNAVFTHVADTNEKNAYTLGVGHGTTTSLNGQDGTGLYWVSDVDGLNLRIYNAIPAAGQNLTLINSFNIPGVTKFTRPVFGNGRVYIGTTLGYLYGFGSPVTLPMNCSSPYAFPKTSIGNLSAPVTVTCTSNIQTTVNSIALTGNANFNISSVPATPFSLTQGQTFSFQAVFAPKTVGPLSSDVVVNTTNGVTGYSTRTPITLTGTANSAKPLLAIYPNTVSFNTIAGQGTDDQTVLFNNNGDQQLMFTNISYSQVSETGPWVTPNMTSDGRVQVGNFLFANVPSNISGDSSAPVTISYVPTQPDNSAVFVAGFSNGGNALLDVLGVAGSQPVALFQFQTSDGTGWVNYVPGMNFTFGNVTENTTRNLKLRLTNNGSATAAPLGVTVSKPPYGVPGIAGAANNIDLAEGTQISVGQSMNATLYCSPPKTQVNTPGYTQSIQWTFNTGDPNLGKVFLNFTCNAVSPQLGPLFSNGTARYGYVGCARDNNPGRQLVTEIYSDTTNNTNGKCVNACFGQGFIFAATEYNSQCWCGNAIPTTFDSDVNGGTCNYQCTGDTSQTCGGNGFYGNTTQMSLFADSTKFNGNTTSAPLAITQSVGNYKYAGCYAETKGKALTAQSYQTSNMTVEYCGYLCGSYSMFGLEYASQCNCGNSIQNGANVTQDSQCSMTCKGSNSEYCGAGNRMQVYSNSGSTVSSSSSSGTATGSVSTSGATSVASTATTTTAVPTSTGNPTTEGSFVYQGCYNEVGGRALTAKSFSNSSNTNGLCASFCSGYTYFATEYSSECYCGNTLSSSSLPVTDGRCSMLCSADSTQICGGANGLSLYEVNASITTIPSTTSSATIVPSSTVAAGDYNLSLTTTVPLTTIVSSTTTASSTTPTSTGNPTTEGSFVYQGCYNEVGGRALQAKSFSNSSNTNGLCASFCSGYTYFATEYSSECYCGNILNSNSLPATDGRCNMLCSADSSQICGGPNGLSLYMVNGTSTTSSSVVSTSSATIAPPSTAASVTAATTSSATPTSTGNPTTEGSYVYQGCYSEVGGRALTAKSYSNSSNTNGFCASFCQGYTYFATEYTSECYCGNVLNANSLPVTDGRCSMLCSADKTQICGGANGLSLYMVNGSSINTSSSSAAIVSTSTATSSSAGASTSAGSSTSTSTSTSSSTLFSTPTPSVLASSGNYVSQGCYSENTSGSGGRVLPNEYANDSMTIPMCAGVAANANAAYFGVEYGRECWYAATLSSISQPIAQSKCSTLCPGNSLNYCGGGNALQLYSLNASSSSSSSTTLMTSTVVTSGAASATSSASTSAAATTTSSSSSAASTTSSSSTTLPTPTPTTATSTFLTALTTLTSTASAISTKVTATVTSMIIPTQTALSCPQSNNQTWYAASGAQFLIECYVDHSGGDINMTHTDTYEGCIQACDNQAGCVDVSLSGSACYMKGKLGSALSASGIRGAKLLVPSGQTSTTVLPTS